MTQRLVVIGAGDLGGEVARRWVALGVGPVLGLTRTPDRHASLEADGVRASTADPRAVLHPSDAVLFTISGSQAQGEAAASLVGVSVRHAVFVSSTGFYGSDSGLLGPKGPPGSSDRAQGVARAEARFRAFHDGVVVRLGGLYRAGRGPQEALRRRGHPLPGPDAQRLPLIHRDDAATALLAALRHPTPDPVYNGVTRPAPHRGEFYRLCCDRLGLDPPSFEGDGVARDWDTSNTERDLLPEPRWPDWSEGMRAALVRSTSAVE